MDDAVPVRPQILGSSMDEISRRRHVPLLPFIGKGRELRDLLTRELGIPDMARSFEVRFAIDEAVTVKVEFIARAKEDDAS